MANYKYVTRTLTYEGKRYYVRGKSEREADRKMGQLEAELRTGSKCLNQKTTVKKWSEEWIAVYVAPRDATAKSLAMYQQKLDNYILPVIGAMRLGDVKDTHLQKILNAANSSFSNAQKVKIVIQALFHQAHRSRLIQYDPAEDLTLPKAPKGTRRSITEIERAAILEVAKTHHAGLFVLLMLYCGVRPGEAIALQWKDVDFDAGILHITKALESGNSAAVKDPKSASGIRDLPIPKELLDALAASRKSPFEPILLQPLGQKRHTDSSINSAWKNFKRTLDIYMGATVRRNQIIASVVAEDLVPYCLRHTYCTDLQRAGVPLNVAKYLMGHSDVSVTANIYTDTTPDVIVLASAQMREFYDNGCKKVSHRPDDQIQSEAQKLAP